MSMNDFVEKRDWLTNLMKGVPFLDLLEEEELKQAAANLIMNGVEVPYERRKENVSPADLSKYEDKTFDELQKNEVSLGFQNGLSDEQVDVYAKPGFNHYQMREIRIGLTFGLSREQVGAYAKPEFNEEQMNVIRVGFELGMTADEISLLAKPDYTWQEMFRIRCKLRNGEMSCEPLKDTIRKAEALKKETRDSESHAYKALER